MFELPEARKDERKYEHGLITEEADVVMMLSPEVSGRSFFCWKSN
jgi:hypothetical protein